MNRRMKELLRQAYEPPASRKRDEFLAKIPASGAGRWDFIHCQAGYIRRHVWIMSLILVGMLLAMVEHYGEKWPLLVLWQVSSLLPLLVLLGMMELVRSVSYNMAELESSCRHNLSEILLVRMGLLAAFDFAILMPLIIALSGKFDFAMGRLLAYLLLPFFCSVAGTLALINLFSTRKTGQLCGVVSMIVAMTHGLLSAKRGILYQPQYAVIWEIVFAALILWSLAGCFKIKRKVENLQWNLS